MSDLDALGGVKGVAVTGIDNPDVANLANALLNPKAVEETRSVDKEYPLVLDLRPQPTFDGGNLVVKQTPRPTWLPVDWASSCCPAYLSVESIRQWFEWTTKGQVGWRNFVKNPGIRDPDVYSKLGDEDVKDAYRLIEVLRQQGYAELPHRPLRDFDPDDAADHLRELRDTVVKAMSLVDESWLSRSLDLAEALLRDLQTYNEWQEANSDLPAERGDETFTADTRFWSAVLVKTEYLQDFMASVGYGSRITKPTYTPATLNAADSLHGLFSAVKRLRTEVATAADQNGLHHIPAVNALEVAVSALRASLLPPADRLDGNLQEDLSGFVSAATIRAKHTPPGIVLDHKALVRFLRLHPNIKTKRPPGRNGKPRTNRLEVHLVDWYTHEPALIEWNSADREVVTKDEVAKRLAAVARNKRGRK